MKKCILLSIVSLLLFSSCSKEDTLLLGKWYFDTSACTTQNQYTDKYKNYCAEHGRDELNDAFDESVHPYEYMFYGYWNFLGSGSSGSYFIRNDGTFCYILKWYYKYMDGHVGKGTSYYGIQGDVLITGGASDVKWNEYEILTLDKKKLVVQERDTFYFFDDDYIKQPERIRIRTFVLNRTSKEK